MQQDENAVLNEEELIDDLLERMDLYAVEHLHPTVWCARTSARSRYIAEATRAAGTWRHTPGRM
jgi:hypothetical protein